MARLRFCLFVILFSASDLRAQSCWPLLNSSSPCAVQIGTTTECELSATYGNIGAYEVLVGGQGVTGEIVGAAAPSVLSALTPTRTEAKIKVRFTATANASVGLRDVRLLTPNGPSSVGQIVVVRDPIVREAKANNSMKEGQAVTLPATLCGAIEAKEDVDYYKFQVEAGAALTFHVISQRLLNTLTEVTTVAAPLITLRNAAGTVLASNDFFFGGDALLHHRFTAAGEYFLEIRDVRYEGNRNWQYAIEAHERPFVATISPACLPPGAPTKVRLIGYNLPADPFVTVTLPADALPWDQWLPLPDVGGKPANAVLVRPCELPLVEQASKLAGSSRASLEARSTSPLPMPASIAGVLDRAGAVDTYAFQAKKGERFTFQIAARPLNSELDSVLRILDAKGDALAENDDFSDRTGHKDRRNEILCADSRIENWEAPADGRYVVEVSDVHGRGGERFTYSLLARPSQPHFRLELTCDRTMIAPGTTGVIFVRSVRKEGFTGDIELKVDGLPAGMTAVCGSIPGPCQDGCIVLCAGDAPARTFGALRVFGTATDSAAIAKAVRAQPFGELMRDGGSRYLVPTNEHVVTVVDAADIRGIRFQPGEVTIKPGETKTVEVSIERRPGFQGAVTLTTTSNLLGSVFGNVLPEGVTLDPTSQIRLTGNQLKGALVFKAAPDAKPVRRQLVPVLGEVSVNFTLRMLHGGDPFWLTVEAAR